MNPRFLFRPSPWIVSCLLLAGFTASASDWPQILGPNRDGIYSGSDLAADWPKEGPKVLWQRKVGDGFSGPAVAGGRLILFHRVANKETVEGIVAATGKSLWQTDYATAYRDDFGFDPGPRAVPTIAGEMVFTYGADGMLQCLSIKDGARKWSVDCLKEFGASKGYFGRACSPLVDGDAVIVNVGGPNGASIVAFNKDSGKVLWKAGNDEPSYSSPVAATINGHRMVVILTRFHFAALDLKDGKPFFITPFRPPIAASVTAANPLVVGDKLFISASYNLGARLYRFKESEPEVIWANDDAMSLQYSTAVLKDGFLYGLHGRHDNAGGTSLHCVEFETGKVRWSKDGLSGANVLLAGDQVLVLTESGELIRAKASPEGYQETGRVQILGSGVRAHPALADGLYFARDKNKLLCIDLRATK